MATNETNKMEADEFHAAFSEDDISPAAQSEDEAFGIMPDEVPGTETPTGTDPSVTIEIDKPAEDAPAEPEAVAAEAAPALDVEKETQRLKSWEGRLKAKEAELSTRQSPADEAEELPGAEDMEAAMGADDGDGDADIAALAEDFGPEFVKMLQSVISKSVTKTVGEMMGEQTGPMRNDIDSMIAEMGNEKQRMHYEKISDAFPDFLDIAADDAFKSFVTTQGPDAEQIVAGGSAKEIIGLLNSYQASKGTDAGADTDMESEINAAEGVRSGGLKLPATPASKNDHDAAWDEA